MSEISSVSSATKLTSQRRASMEKTETPQEIKSVDNFSLEIEQLERAFSIAQEIRTSLEGALKNLSD